MRRSPLIRSDFPEALLLVRSEGGCVYTADYLGRFYIIVDESSMAALLSEEDLADLSPALVKVLEFDTAAERDVYIQERGSMAKPKSHQRQRDL
jgi:hypothetical protein